MAIKNQEGSGSEDGSQIGGIRVHFPSTPVKYLADLRNRVNSQRYSSIYEESQAGPCEQPGACLDKGGLNRKNF